MRAQVAFEYLVIVIIVLAFLTPLWIYLSQVKTQTVGELSLSYAKNAVKKIADASDLVYSQRLNAKVRIGVYIPRNVQEINITGKMIDMRVLSDSTLVDVFENTKADLNGSLPTNEGFYWILVEAKGDYVQISLA
jgi:uncharacterized protein (UPF0333 family)